MSEAWSISIPPGMAALACRNLACADPGHGWVERATWCAPLGYVAVLTPCGSCGQPMAPDLAAPI